MPAKQRPSGRKKWYPEKNAYADANAEANVNVPDGAWAEFTLYRVYSDGSEEEVETIRLDGTKNEIGEEEAWAAAFRDLETVDEDGNPVSYYVKETAVSDLSAQQIPRIQTGGLLPM